MTGGERPADGPRTVAPKRPRGLKASPVADKVAWKSPLFPGWREALGISMSPGRGGSGATRIEADLSIKRGEK